MLENYQLFYCSNYKSIARSTFGFKMFCAFCNVMYMYLVILILHTGYIFWDPDRRETEEREKERRETEKWETKMQ